MSENPCGSRHLITAKRSNISSNIADVMAKFESLKLNIQKALQGIDEDHGEFKKNIEFYVEQVNFGKHIIDSLHQLKVNASKVYEKLVPILEYRAIQNKNIEFIDVIIDIWKNKNVFENVVSVREILYRLERLKEETEKFEKLKTAERLEEKNNEIIKWYNILNPDEEIRFSRMGLKESTKHRQIDLKAELYRKPANAASMLSEAHINATGLSVYLSQIVSPFSPIKFVMLDDPVQSMDLNHQARFESSFIEEILNNGYQVFIFSHLKNFVDNIRTCHNLDWYYEITSYDINGPVILERGNKLEEYIKQAKQFKSGSSDHRTHAVHLLRKAIENFCREVYFRKTGNKLEKNLTSSVLKELAINIFDDVRDHQKLNYVLKYADPASHDDNTSEPPENGIIDSLIDNVLNLIEKYLDPQIRRKTKI